MPRLKKIQPDTFKEVEDVQECNSSIADLFTSLEEYFWEAQEVIPLTQMPAWGAPSDLWTLLCPSGTTSSPELWVSIITLKSDYRVVLCRNSDPTVPWRFGCVTPYFYFAILLVWNSRKLILISFYWHSNNNTGLSYLTIIYLFKIFHKEKAPEYITFKSTKEDHWKGCLWHNSLVPSSTGHAGWQVQSWEP